jgi:predicted dinucleotide-binding enzyme
LSYGIPPLSAAIMGVFTACLGGVFRDVLNDFSDNKPKTVIFASGDDKAAKRVVIDLLNGVGFAAIDLGSLR